MGTRVFYDASKYRKLDAGLARIVDPAFRKDSLIPWARLQSVSGAQAPFVLTSNHLRVGVVGSRKEWKIRARQVKRTIAVLQSLQRRFGDQPDPRRGPELDGQHAAVQQRALGADEGRVLRRVRECAHRRRQVPGHAGQPLPAVPALPLRRDYLLTLGPVKGSVRLPQPGLQAARIASDHFLQVATVRCRPGAELGRAGFWGKPAVLGEVVQLPRSTGEVAVNAQNSAPICRSLTG